jgi:type IV fimbrial biogenesis protein FimT
VLSLMMVILLSSVAAYRDFMEKNQLVATVNRLVGALRFARMTAMTSQQTMAFCPQGDHQQCGEDWQRGQIVVNEKKQRVLRFFPALPVGYQLQWKSTLGESDALRFRADGFTRGQQGSLFICRHFGAHPLSARIVILRTGRLRSEMGYIPQCG